MASLDCLSELCRAHGIDILYSYGSNALAAKRWIGAAGGGESRWHADSDLDIGVQPLRRTRHDVVQKVRLANALEDLFKVERVDLVLLPEADPFLAANVIRGGEALLPRQTSSRRVRTLRLKTGG